MALVSINHNPAQRELRQFGLVFFPLFVAMVGWFVYRAADSRIVPIVCGSLAALSILLGALRPAAVKPVWTQLGGARAFMESMPFWEMNP